MSSKKEIRRKRRATKGEQKGRAGNPVFLFALGIGAAIVLTLAAFALLRDGSAAGEPPWPGAVWSAAHDHWH